MGRTVLVSLNPVRLAGGGGRAHSVRLSGVAFEENTLMCGLRHILS